MAVKGPGGVLSFYGFDGIHGYSDLPAAAFLRARPIALVLGVFLQPGQEEGAEPAFGGMDAAQAMALQQVDEESLRQVLGVLGLVALAAQEGVNRPPVFQLELQLTPLFTE